MLLLQTISITVIAAIMLGGAVFLFVLFLQVRRIAKEAEKTIQSVRMQIGPVAHEVTVMSGEVKGIVQSIHRQVETIEDSVGTIRESAGRIREFEEEMLHRFERPLFELSTVASGISRGVGTFFQVLLRR